jgi:transcriptional regulator with XRE-family HTH domain
MVYQIHFIDQHVGGQIRKVRMTRGYSRNDLGKLVGISSLQLRKFETGVNRVNALCLAKFASALKVNVGEFFRGLPKTRASNSLPALKSYISPSQALKLIEACSSIEDINTRLSSLRVIADFTKKISKGN